MNTKDKINTSDHWIIGKSVFPLVSNCQTIPKVTILCCIPISSERLFCILGSM